VDVDSPIAAETLGELKRIDGVLGVRYLPI
jgi:hypothetical protein